MRGSRAITNHIMLHKLELHIRHTGHCANSNITDGSVTLFFLFQVFEAVVTWVNHDPEHRQDCLAQLMEHVRLPLLSREYLVSRVETEMLVKNNNMCKDFLIEAMKYHLLSNEQRSSVQSPRTRPRTPIGLPKVMYVVGGQAPKAIRR